MWVKRSRRYNQKRYPEIQEVSPKQYQYLQMRARHGRIVQSMRFLLLAGFLGLWEVAADLGWIDSFIFSSPGRILQTFWKMVRDGSIFLHVRVTLVETIISFLLVVLFGILCAVLLWCNDQLSEILEPYLVVLNSLPKSALAPLLIVWLGANSRTIIVAGMSVAIFGTILNLYTGFREVSVEKIRLIYTLGGKRRHVLTKVILPSTVPATISIMKVNIGLCLVGVVIGEFIGARCGLGYLIIYSSQVFKLNILLMSMVLLCIIAMGLYALISAVERWYLKKI
ncbi:MAG: ABC transporter permease [Eubacteriales bacterium]|nr:ABC transporter permease [Eubacteriales bacterium]